MRLTHTTAGCSATAAGEVRPVSLRLVVPRGVLGLPGRSAYNASVSFRVQTERLFAASAAEIFAAWTEPVVMRRWFHMAESWSTPHAEVDLRRGGVYRVDMVTGNGQALTYRGTYVEVDPPRRLAFTWPPLAQPDVVTTVTVEMIDQPGGSGTLVSLTHDGLSDDETAKANQEGWTAVLKMLKRRGLVNG